MANKKPFTLPKLMRSKSNRSAKGDWYVEFFYEYPDRPGETKSFKVRDGINYINDLEDKEREGLQLVKDITRALEKENYNPFIDYRNTYKQIQEAKSKIAKENEKFERWSIIKAVTAYFAFIDTQGYSTDTTRTYKKYVRLFQTWVIENNYHDRPISTFTEMELSVFLNEMFEDLSWSGRTFNNYLEGMVTFFKRSAKLEKIATLNRNLKYDFDAEELEGKNTVPQRNKAFTPLLADLVIEQLEKPGFENLSDYVEWIFLSLMRPKEIRALKVGDIDHINRQIRIKGKTGDRIVPVSNQLMGLITRRGLLKNDINNFVFGYAGNIDYRRMSVAYFLNQFSEIRSELNLDSNYGPYSFKHTAVIALIQAGFSDEEIMVLTGHKTIEAFRTYKRDLVVDNSHVMKGNAVDF